MTTLSLAWLIPLGALVLGSGGVLGYLGLRRNTDQQRLKDALERGDKDRGQKFAAINYAQRLRNHIDRGDPPPPEDWPNDITD